METPRTRPLRSGSRTTVDAAPVRAIAHQVELYQARRAALWCRLLSRMEEQTSAAGVQSESLAEHEE